MAQCLRAAGGPQNCTRAIGQSSAKKRMLAIDTLMTYPGDLFGEALDQAVIDVGTNDFLHPARSRVLDPDFSGAVDEDFGNSVAFQPFRERAEISLQIDAALALKVDIGCVPFRMFVRQERMDIGSQRMRRFSLRSRNQGRGR